MQLKDEAGPSEVPPRVYYHLVRRFKKAVQWSKMLCVLSADRVDNKTALEIEVGCGGREWMDDGGIDWLVVGVLLLDDWKFVVGAGAMDGCD